MAKVLNFHRRLDDLERRAAQPDGAQWVTLWTDNGNGTATNNQGKTLPVGDLPVGAILVHEEVVRCEA